MFGPGSSAVSTAFSFLKVLLDMGHFGVLGTWWDKDGGRNGLGSLSFRRFTIVVISFPFGHVVDVATTKVWVKVS
jgi:hypothetical protein